MNKPLILVVDVYKRQGMDRVTRFNVIALSGKAVETCGDVDTMILDLSLIHI